MFALSSKSFSAHCCEVWVYWLDMMSSGQLRTDFVSSILKQVFAFAKPIGSTTGTRVDHVQ